MELNWKTSLNKATLFDLDNNEVCSFDLQDPKFVSILGYKITLTEFDSYHVKDNFDQKVQLYIDTINLSLSVDAVHYHFVYENRHHCYIQIDRNIIASCYKDYGIFNSSGSVIVNDNIEHKPIFLYALLSLRQAARNIGAE